MAVVEMLVEPTRHRFTVADYYAMADAGILDPDARLELVEGEVYDMSPISPEHSSDVNFLNNELKTRLGSAVWISVQSPLRLDDESEPLPDLVLLRPRADRYRSALPIGRDALLVIEVAQTSLVHDRSRKVPLYARAGVSELWIVNLPEAVIETWADPVAGAYRAVRVYRRGDRLAPRAFPDCQLAVDDIVS